MSMGQALPGSNPEMPTDGMINRREQTMAKSEKQKLKLLYIIQCLMEKTDEEHSVTTQEIIDYIIYAKEKGCSMQGTEDINVERLNVLV